MKKNLVYILFTLFTITAFAQDERSGKSFKEKLFLGGNLGLTFGDYTFINVSPQLGYRFNRLVAAGAGLNFQYVSQKEYYGGELDHKAKLEIVGLNVFGRVYPIPNFMIQVQPEMNYISGSQTYYATSYNPTGFPNKINFDAKFVPSVLAGGGLVLPSPGGALVFSVMYDVLQDANSPYDKRPVYNIGYNFNLR